MYDTVTIPWESTVVSEFRGITLTLLFSTFLITWNFVVVVWFGGNQTILSLLLSLA